jgi:hypothetical protein
VLKNRASVRDPALRDSCKCVLCPTIEGWEAGKLEAKPFLPFFSLLAFQPPSLQPIAALADGRMLVFKHPAYWRFSGCQAACLISNSRRLFFTCNPIGNKSQLSGPPTSGGMVVGSRKMDS